MANNKKATALILAASRRGPEDAVAKIQNISHKCLVVIDGMVMLERVVREIKEADDIGDIYVSIESRDLIESVPALKEMLDKEEIHYTPSAENLFLSVKSAIEHIESPWPLVISTGDNALHTSEMINHFTNEIFSNTPDAAIAMTPASVILEAYPDGKRAFHELKDGGWSSCNLYALTTANALTAAKVFEGGGQFGKQPKRILKAFGLMFMMLYKFKLASSAQLTNLLSKRWGLNIRLISMPYADAPIDVDNPGDFVRTEEILKKRRGA
ncbi:NTP transferase domain-containing protein [Kordiimonas sp. SCSIO 12610]|uniref:NTP transferase domain-containing protein n=1 Tax=Kordiimonas sp. SCSIO 12610 TaxID=2829597 RepID=UPI00210C04D5|nr:NTP transferase domain-containing protein [Kordiimonas sp. SCSIO 12610]UTW55167.1 nucleotidyltransferase family protein [Kordiimonas sp. SCSIO 12610]